MSGMVLTPEEKTIEFRFFIISTLDTEEGDELVLEDYTLSLS